jgi:hypothetical protein
MGTYFPCYDEDFSDEVGIEGLLYPGDGVKMGLEAGVGNDGTISFEWGTRPLPFYTGDLGNLPVVSLLADNLKTPEALWVNNVGVRFTDESGPLGANAIYHQPNKDCFIVLDQGVAAHLSKKHPGIVSAEKLREEMTPLIEANQGIIADSTGAVAAWIRGKKQILQHAIDVSTTPPASRAWTIFTTRTRRPWWLSGNRPTMFSGAVSPCGPPTAPSR